jgi:hypothetical protein
MNKRYYLVPGSSAQEIERKTGLYSLDTPFGALIERPPELRELAETMQHFHSMFSEKECECRGVIHNPNCPFGGAS